MSDEQAQQLLHDAGDQVAVGAPPTTALIRAGRRAKRRRRLVGVAGTAAVTALVIGVAAALVDQGDVRGPVAEPPTSDGATPEGLKTPPGTRLVGYRGVAVAVPAAWEVNRTRCGTPVQDTVNFVPHHHGDPRCYVQQRVSSLTSATADYAEEATDTRGARPARDLEGVPTLKTPTIRGCNQSPAPTTGCTRTGLWHGALVIPSLNVSMWVESPDPAVVNAILDSVRLIPDGYAAVPDLSGVTSDSRVGQLVDEAGLVWENRCPQDVPCEMSPITATDPPAGSVVAVGTTVRAAESSTPTVSELRGVPPTEADLLGTWRVVSISGREATIASPPDAEVNVVEFSVPRGSRIGWEGYAACNRIWGRVELGPNGGYSTGPPFETTTVHCGDSRLEGKTTAVDVVMHASQVRLLGGRLRFYDAGDALLGTFVRAD